VNRDLGFTEKCRPSLGFNRMQSDFPSEGVRTGPGDRSRSHAFAAVISQKHAKEAKMLSKNRNDAGLRSIHSPFGDQWQI